MLLTKLPVAVGLAGVALAANAVTYTPGTYTEKVNGHNAHRQGNRQQEQD